MCLAVPMKLVELQPDQQALAELEGVRSSVNISLLDGAALGDYVIVHAGFAIEKLDEAAANAQLELLRQLVK